MVVKYVSLGIIIDDIVFPDGQTRMGLLGGGGAQTAWGMALAAKSGEMVGMLSGVGADFPTQALEPLERMGIDVSGVHVTDLPTARAWQILEQGGRRTHVWRVDQDTSDHQTHPSWNTIRQFYPDLEAIHWGLHPEAPYLAPCKALRDHGVLISLEPFKGMDEPLSDSALRAVLSQCEIYSPTWDEAVSLFGTDDRQVLLQRAADLGGHILALRMGAKGADIWDLKSGNGVRIPAAPVENVIDPVGAGDAFCGAFTATWHETHDLARSGVSGAVAASYMLEQVGIPGQRPGDRSIAQRTKAVRIGVQALSTRLA